MMEALFSRVLTASLLFLLPAALLLPPIRRRIAPRARGAMELLLCARLLLPLWPRAAAYHNEILTVISPERPAALSGSEIAALIWCAGAALFLLGRLAGRLLCRRRMARWSRAPVSPETAALWERLRRECGVRRGPSLLVCPEAPGPLLTGLLRPAVLIPDERDAAALEAALRHELWHWRRGDLWRKLLFDTARALHWFNPAVRWMARRAGEDLELCCDEAALRGCGEEERLRYAEALLRELRRGRPRRAGFAARFGGGAAARERLLHLLQPPRGRGGPAPAALLAAALALTTGLFGLRTYTMRPVDAASSAGDVARLEAQLGRFLTECAPFGEVRVSLEPDRPGGSVDLRGPGEGAAAQVESIRRIVASMVKDCDPGSIRVTGAAAPGNPYNEEE